MTDTPPPAPFCPPWGELGKYAVSNEAFWNIGPEAEAILIAHGCCLEMQQDAQHHDYWLVHFPDGTFKREKLPRIHNARHNIYLPAGLKLAEVGTSCGISYLESIIPPAEA
ncbi:hypothetical protein EPA93_31170 [Ktedonosporobacter rubrisoli]|uniref:Uncharacterized protein n=1 Tax=Ktedonosporobacter rubrisoli TaxID=2509675 RepID=A0A4V0YZM1_KTERU|nr:hypothetical protein [Ktedonosporobacter rubrisoli]QBD80201.1 hypothetical protein EPA93_31170 [Ktedonosporobacter rubrisoli]